MRGFLTLCLFLPLAGCFVGGQRARTSTTVTRDTGVPGLERTTYESEQSGSYIGGQMPMMPGGVYGPGSFGPMTVTTGSCVLHPDNCGGIHTATVVQPPVTVVSTRGGASGGSAGSYDESAGDPELDAYLAKHEKAIGALVGQNKQSVRQTCQILIANPEVLKDPAERKEVIATCEAYLAKHPYNPGKEEK